MLFLRSLVLLGLFFANNAFSATVYTIGNKSDSSAAGVCNLVIQQNQASRPSWIYILSSVSETICRFNSKENAQQVTPYFNEFDIMRSCTAGVTGTINDGYDVFNPDQSGATTITAPYPATPPASQCYQGCIVTTTGAQTVAIGPVINFSRGVSVSYPYSQTSTQCGTPPPPQCVPPYVKQGTQCVLPPTCTLPAVLDAASNTCVVPACPSGTTRVTTGAACTPIACVPPMVLQGTVCDVPKCSTGETYEFKNGAGSCVKMGNPCPSPATLINGTCQNPVCAAGTALNASGQCAASTGATSTGSTASGTGPATSTSTSTSTTTTTNTSTGSTSTTTSTGTQTGPVTGVGGGSGGSGTCTTPPCGACDPAVTTCGTTFGGSCQSDFQCSGDAVQCAVAKATNKSECALLSIKVKTEDNPVYTEGETVVNAGAGGAKRPGTEGGISSPEQAITQIEKSNPFNSSCPADYSLATYKGTEIKIPLSKMCNIFEIMGKIMLACAGLICVRILTKED